jgi:hypothetical protein
VTEKELLKLYQMRLKDRKHFTTKRRKSLNEVPPAMDVVLNQFFRNDKEALVKIEQNRALLAWSTYVGKVAATHSKALKISKNKLIVIVKDPLWRQELILMKSSLLRKFRKDYPTLGLQDIFFTAYYREAPEEPVLPNPPKER